MPKLVTIFSLLLLLASGAVSAATITIEEARDLPLGTTVTVEGSVTVPSGDFASSTFDQGFAIQDDTAGIYVSVQENPGLNFNRTVRVTGTLDDDGFGLLVIRPGSVETTGGASLVEADSVATGAVGESTEGSLVEVTGTITQPVRDDLPFGYSIFIDDGSGEVQIFIPASTGINPFKIPYAVVGAEITATGFSGQFLAQDEVLPRRRGDIKQAN